MSPTKKTDERLPSAGALKLLRPPTEAMLFDAETAKAAQELDRMLKRGTGNKQTTRAVLDALNVGSPVLYTRGGGFGATTVVEGPSFLEALRGLYVPVEALPEFLPASQRYMHEQTWPGAVGSTAAYKRNGKLTAIQSVHTTVSSESSWAGVYASFRPDQARFGKLGRVTIDPEVYWTGRDILDPNFTWTANIDGHIWFNYRIWTVVYEFNVASKQYEPLLSNRSAVATTVAQSNWHIVGGGESGHGGALRNSEGALAFVVEPNRTYLFGVVAQMQVQHSLRRSDGQPIPQPSGSDLTAYGLLKADVPAIYMSHVVLAK